MACWDGLVSVTFVSVVVAPATAPFSNGVLRRTEFCRSRSCDSGEVQPCRRAVFQWRVATVWFLVALVLVVVTRFVSTAALIFNGVLRRSPLSLLSFPGACVSCLLFPPRLLKVAFSLVVQWRTATSCYSGKLIHASN
ncbi:hypothetical protein ARMGADRAFT_756095 [Armillaria gallica]|uniref:Uncharacterized protein n=1 Tax=Armillaria gallica TaxID=47427 RepID=A0A2H3DPI1_ARMGA|nr:hypothetical protein ARMGADRAFT_756095 [Armillaria gallica]